jgi:hypothetical protein
VTHEHEHRPRNVEHPGRPIRCENCGLPIPLPAENGRVWVYRRDGKYYDRPSCTDPRNRGQRAFEI